MKKEHIVLGIIFLLTFACRLYFSFTANSFEYESYFNLRQTEYIMEHGVPNYSDEYSYGGRFFTFLPAFNYILAFFSFPLGLEIAAKIIPNLLASLLCIVVYLISKEITKEDYSALAAAFVSGFVPVFFSETVNSVSNLTAVLPITILLAYLFINIKKSNAYVVSYIVFFVVLTLLHPSSIVFVASLFFYLLICKIERINVSDAEVEISIFSIFFWLWANLMIYKKAFLQHGASIIWQNLPPMLYQQNFMGLDIIQALIKIGVLPFIFGLIVVFKGFFGEKNRATFFFVAFAFSTSIMLWLKLITLALGLIFLGVVLAILFGQFYFWLFRYLGKTKISHYKPFLVVGIIAVFAITSVFTALYQTSQRTNHPSNGEIAAFIWLNKNTPKDAVILTTPDEGHLLSYLAQRKNVADTNFILAPNLNQRLTDIHEIYTTRFKTKAIGLLNKYDVSFIYFSEKTKSSVGVKDIIYKDYTCIKEIYSKNGVKIYESVCTLS